MPATTGRDRSNSLPDKFNVVFDGNSVSLISKVSFLGVCCYNTRNTLINQTESEYREVIARCRALFEKKTQDYGTSWRILRPSSLTDQIFIKAQRIRSIEEKGTQKIDEDVCSEFVGIINYCIIALIQAELGSDASQGTATEDILAAYDKHAEINLSLLKNKNHDYGEAWRDMRVSSMTDIILMKLLRIRQIEENRGETLVSEGVESGYRDIINYAVFALIKLNFHHHEATL